MINVLRFKCGVYFTYVATVYNAQYFGDRPNKGILQISLLRNFYLLKSCIRCKLNL